MTTTVDFAIEHEAWSVYTLDDGTRVKVRTILTGIRRNDAVRAPDGSPSYEWDIQTIVAPEVAPSLKTQPNPADRKDTA